MLRSTALFFLCLLSSLAFGQTMINPASQVRWPSLTGSGTPTSLSLPCAPTNYGQPYQNTGVTPNVLYTCGSDGWSTRGSAGSISASPGGSQTINQPTTTGLFVRSTDSNTTYNSLFQSNLDNGSPATIYNYFTSSGTNSDAIAGVVNVLNGNTHYQENGVAGYANCANLSTNCTATSGYTHCDVAGGNCWGGNLAVIDGVPYNGAGEMYALELDTQPQGPASAYPTTTSILGVWSALFAPQAGLYGENFVSVRSEVGQWNTSYHSLPGAAATGLWLGPISATAFPANGQPIRDDATGTITPSTITGFSITSNVATIKASQSYTAGEEVQITGLSVGTYLNGTLAVILSSGLSGSQFEIAFTHANVATTTDSGTAAIFVTETSQIVTNAAHNSLLVAPPTALALGAATDGAVEQPSGNYVLPGGDFDGMSAHLQSTSLTDAGVTSGLSNATAGNYLAAFEAFTTLAAQWSYDFQCQTPSAPVCLLASPLAAGASQASQKLQFNANSSSNTLLSSFIYEDDLGNLNFNPSTGFVVNGVGAGIPIFGTPASSSATCTQGQVEFDAAYLYTCVAANTWRRAATVSF